MNQPSFNLFFANAVSCKKMEAANGRELAAHDVIQRALLYWKFRVLDFT